MTRKRKIDDKLSSDHSSTGRPRRTSESLIQDKTQIDNAILNEDDNNSMSITNSDNSTVTNSDSDKLLITNTTMPLIEKAANDQPIRKSHRISKLRKAIKTTVSAASASPLSPSSSTGISSKNQLPNNSSSNTVNTSASNSAQQSQTQNNAQQSNNSSMQTPSNIPSKPIRKILVWSENDTRWFFEALCEHGKDFHHIQAYIASKYEKKGIAADLIKNYENVRHYYYRMWHKVSQMLKLPHEIERVVLETYGLINYGELWKRVGSKLDVKLIGNLQQLVLYGFTAFKVKGKMYRVRTPICNALKRIHNIQVPKPPSYQIPKEIIVEIIPETNRDWIHVQKLSQNPRLRTKLTMQHRLSSLIEYLEKRWNKENLLERAMQHLFTDPGEELPPIEPSFSIRLRPKNADKICTEVYLKATGSIVGNLRTLPSQNSNLDLSLASFLNKQKLKNSKDNRDGVKSTKAFGKEKDKEDKNESFEDKNSNDAKEKSDKTFSKSHSNDDKSNDKKEDSNSNEEVSNSEKKSNENKGKDDSEMPSFQMFQMLNQLNEKCSEENSETIEDEDVIIEEGRLFDLEPSDLFEAVSLLEPPENMTLVQWLDSEGQEESAVQEEEKEEEEGEKEEEKEEEPVTVAIKNAPEVGKTLGRKRTNSVAAQDVELCNLEAAKRGWTKEEADSLSIGELFLLVGCPEKIQLEYSWIELTNSIDKDSFITEEGKNDVDFDEEIFDRLAFCANALLSSFKKPSSFHYLESRASTSIKPKIKNAKEVKRKEPKKPIAKTSKPAEVSSCEQTESSNANVQTRQTSIEVIDESKKKAAKTTKKVQDLPESNLVPSRALSERLPSSGVRVQAVSEEKVKEALADLYNNSHNILRRNNLNVLKSPLKSNTPRKDKPVEFVVELGPSFVQNSGQGTFQIQQNNIQPITSKSPTPLIPVKFIPATNVTTHQQQHTYQPFSQHQSVHPGQAEQAQFQNCSSEFNSPFLQQALPTNPTAQQHPQQNPSQTSSTWLNELHNESSMGSLLAACDLISHEMTLTKRDITLTDNSVDLISQFADFATQQHNLQS